MWNRSATSASVELPSDPSYWEDERDQPIRREPFSVAHLEELAEQVARAFPLTAIGGDDRRLRKRFEQNSRYIAATYDQFSAAIRTRESIPADAEWLIDNYYLVQNQLREIRQDLPRSYYRELPKFTTGPWKSLPRVYALAYELVAHTDSSLDTDVIVGFVEAYQGAAPLTSGELWAVSIMLRLVLVENLCRLCKRMRSGQQCRLQAQRILSAFQSNENSPDTAVAMRENPMLVTQLLECLHDVDMAEAANRARVHRSFGHPAGNH